MAPRRSAAAEAEEQENEAELVTLKFKEPLSWRPGKPIPIDQLLKRLNSLSKELSEMDQDTVDPNSLTKVAKELASHQLLNHKDKGVRAYAACCIVDILRLCAPDAPFTPSQLKVRAQDGAGCRSCLLTAHYRISSISVSHLSYPRFSIQEIHITISTSTSYGPSAKSRVLCCCLTWRAASR